MVRGERIRDRLEAAGLSQSELARRVGLTQGTIAKLVNGTAQGSSHLHRIARTLGTTPAYLTGETDDPESYAQDLDITPDEAELLTGFRQLSKEDQEAVKRIVARMTPRAVHAPLQTYRANG